VRDRGLHDILEAFTADAAGQLAAETAGGVEVPFEIVEGEQRPGHAPLYCYRPLTEEFIDERLGLLSALPTYAPAARALSAVERVPAYLVRRGVQQVPSEPRARADAALRSFLRAVFADRSQFGFDPVRFEQAYEELERALYDGQSTTTIVAPLLGVALDEATGELLLGDGLSLVQGEALAGAPAEVVWGDRGQPHVLATLTVNQDPTRPPPVSLARARFRRLLTALRLFESGGYALGPLGWSRTDSAPWRPIALGGSGRPRLPTLIRAQQEDELRAFCNLVARRTPNVGALTWALARFEMGCERLVPFEALTDYLLALRALLEPEGPDSGRLPGRLAAICATPDQRSMLAERMAHATALEHAVMTGSTSPEPGVDALVDQVCEHLRALLRDLLCGHLDPDLVRLADELLGEVAAVPTA
jgi:hypothetical protein